MNLYKVATVAKREFLVTIKTKAFLLSILMVPVMIVGISFFTQRIEKDIQAPKPPKSVTIVDQTGQLEPLLTPAFEKIKDDPEQRTLNYTLTGPLQEEQLEEKKDALKSGKFEALLVIPANIITPPQSDQKGQLPKLQLFTRGLKAGEQDIEWTLRSQVNSAVIQKRCEVYEIERSLLSQINRYAPIEEVVLGTASAPKVQEKQQKMVNMMIPFFFMFMIFMGVFAMGQYMLTNVIEEKSSRVMEILLSCVSPFELMSGKIFGLSAVGFCVMLIWGSGAVGAAIWRGVEVQIEGPLLIYFAIYYVLGYLLFSSILAGLGSVCNTLKEAQSPMVLINFVFIIPMISWFNLVQNPNGILARSLSYFPLTTPMVMVLRLAATDQVHPLEIAGTILVLVILVPAVIFFAARVFRTGILMYGKKPSIREIARWICKG